MGERLTIWAYRHDNPDDFLRKLDSAVQSHSGRLLLGHAPGEGEFDCRVALSKSTQSLYLQNMGGAERAIATTLGVLLGVPWLVLMVSEGSVWEYVLYNDSRCLDRFCVAPEYWSEDSKVIDAHRGNCETLARAWRVPEMRLTRYLRNWGYTERGEDEFEFSLTGKAYDADKHEYGDVWQMFDFLIALEGKNPTNVLDGAVQHSIVIPKDFVVMG